MTTAAPDPLPVVELVESKPDAGCTAKRCGDNRTVQLHPGLGRRCPRHITLPPGAFRPDLAADMVDLGRADSAFAYLGAYLAREVDQRFHAASPWPPFAVGRLTSGVLAADVVIDVRWPMPDPEVPF